MKKLLLVISLILYAILGFSQEYISPIQEDFKLSGEKEISHHNATLFFNHSAGMFSIKFDGLSENKFNITYMDIRTINDGDVQIMYMINEDTNYGGLRIVKYNKALEIEGEYYSLSFTIIGMNQLGEIAYYTTFYVNNL